MATHRQALTTCGVLLAGLLISTTYIAAQTPKTLYSFTGSDGANPQAGVTSSGTVLYGTTHSGGSAGFGTVYSPTAPASPGGAWTEAVLYNFSGGSDGANPSASVVIGSGGVLYGTTFYGGQGFGTVFSLTPPASPGGVWTEAVLHSFTDGTDGLNPLAGVTIGKGGALYGTTYNANNVFKLSPPASPGGKWHSTVLYTFPCTVTSCAGGGPTGIVIGKGGVLYSTTVYGGSCSFSPIGCGTVFSLTPPATAGGAWTESTLYNFTGAADGESPQSVAIGSGGVLYGAAEFGGSEGTVFSLTPPASPGGAWTEATLHNFTGGTDGAAPAKGVVIGQGGVLYGTTIAGGNGSPGVRGYGTVYSLTPPASPGGAWTETILSTFNGRNGSNPNAGVVIGPGGALYGVTGYGGASGAGTVFALQP